MAGRNPSLKRQTPRTPEVREAERYMVERWKLGQTEADRLAAMRKSQDTSA